MKTIWKFVRAAVLLMGPACAVAAVPGCGSRHDPPPSAQAPTPDQITGVWSGDFMPGTPIQFFKGGKLEVIKGDHRITGAYGFSDTTIWMTVGPGLPRREFELKIADGQMHLDGVEGSGEHFVMTKTQ